MLSWLRLDEGVNKSVRQVTTASLPARSYSNSDEGQAHLSVRNGPKQALLVTLENRNVQSLEVFDLQQLLASIDAGRQRR